MQSSNTEFDYVSTDTNTTLEIVRALRRTLNSHTGAVPTSRLSRLMLDEWDNISRRSNIRREYNRYLSRQVVVLAGTRGGKGIITPIEPIFERESNDIDYDMI